MHCLCTYHGFESRTLRQSWVRSVDAWHSCLASRRTGLNSRRIHQWGHGQVGKAPGSHPGNRGFKPRCPFHPSGRGGTRHTPTVESRSYPGSNPGVRTTPCRGTAKGGDGVCKTPEQVSRWVRSPPSAPASGCWGARSPTCFGSRHHAGSNPAIPTTLRV